MTNTRRSDGGRSRRLLWLTALLVIVAAGWLAAGTNGRGLRASLADRTEAARYFEQLGAPPGAGPVIDFRQHDRDGMQNEDASGSYRVPLPAAAILDHYRRACRQRGLTSPPSAETRTYYPNALCDGAVIVTVEPRCTGPECTVFVEVVG